MAERAAPTGPPVLPAHERESLAAAAAALAAGGIVGLPTETVYGVGVVPRAEALKALVVAKRRPEEKGIALLVDDLAQVEDLVLVGAVARRLAARFWPGPLTLVLPLRRADLVPAALSGGRDTLAVRLPDHAVPRVLARELGPLAVSSANLSGRPEAHTAAALVDALGPSLALVLDDGPVRGGVPSSVVAVDAAGRVEVFREGAIGRTLIEALLAGGA
jgi:L-threonylcarbamoyladenylate synthase